MEALLKGDCWGGGADGFQKGVENLPQGNDQVETAMNETSCNVH